MADAFESRCTIPAYFCHIPFGKYTLPEYTVLWTIPDVPECIRIKVAHYVLRIFIKTAGNHLPVPGYHRIEP